jgi:addiction module HigA family antidote
MVTKKRARTRRKTTRREVPLIHPGEILRKDFLEPYRISQYRLAKDTAVPPRRINEIVSGTRGISADTALRLSLYFGTTPQFWLNLQSHYDIEMLRARAGKQIAQDVKRRPDEAA